MTLEFEIRTLAEGEKITEAGFYNIPMHIHHNQPCDGYSVTSSVLRKCENGTPADVWAYHPDNPEREEDTDSEAMKMGRVMAAFIEDGLEGLNKQCFVLPTPKPSRPTEAQLEKIKQGEGTDAGLKSYTYWKEQDADPRDQITKEQLDLIIKMGKVLAKDPAACAALGGIPEITMAWQDDRTGIWCLARPDQISFSGMVSDYKKVATRGGYLNGWVIDRRIEEYGYDMQMAFAGEGFFQLTRNHPDQVGLIFQWEKAPHHVILREIDEEELAIAKFRNDRALMTIAESMESGHWAGPGEHVGRFVRNEKNRERLLNEMQIAGVAP